MGAIVILLLLLSIGKVIAGLEWENAVKDVEGLYPLPIGKVIVVHTLCFSRLYI